MDETYIRPFFIRDYNYVTSAITAQIYELIEEKFDDKNELEVFEKLEAVKTGFS